jgi:hypothetical protein
MTKMTVTEAIQMAESWTKDMKEEGISHQMPIWIMVKTLLDHIDRQSKDITELTFACRSLLIENRRRQDAIQRSQRTRRKLDAGT